MLILFLIFFVVAFIKPVRCSCINNPICLNNLISNTILFDLNTHTRWLLFKSRIGGVELNSKLTLLFQIEANPLWTSLCERLVEWSRTLPLKAHWNEPHYIISIDLLNLTSFIWIKNLFLSVCQNWIASPASHAKFYLNAHIYDFWISHFNLRMHIYAPR